MEPPATPLPRRTFLSSALALGAAGPAGFVAACSSDTQPEKTESAIVSPSAQSTTEPAGSSGSGSKMLMVYFSRAGEQYWDGGRRTVSVGNTAMIAGFISNAAHGDVYRIEAADAYPSAYEPTVARNVSEMQADARPEIADPLPLIDSYDTILLRSPVWAVQAPMIMRTLVEGVAGLAGKTVHPFVTYAVSQMGNVMDDYTRLYSEATFGEGLAIRGEEARQAESQVREWLSRIGVR